MSGVDVKIRREEMKEKFGDLPLEILDHISDFGRVWYVMKNGKRVYGLPEGIRTQYDPPLMHEDYTGKGETQQQFRDDCDINHILRRYGASPNYVPGEIQIALENFRDLSLQPGDLTEAINIVEGANAAFMELPAELRRAVNDDPNVLLELSNTKDGLKKLVDAGFGSKKTPSELEKNTEALREFVNTLTKKDSDPTKARGRSPQGDEDSE